MKKTLPILSTKPPFLYIAYSVMFILLYFIGAKSGASLFKIHNKVLPFFHPAGVAYGCLFIFGKKYWPAIALGSFLTQLMNGDPLISSLLITTGNTLQTISAVLLYEKVKTQNETFGIYTGTFSILASAIFSPFFSSSIGTAALGFNHFISWSKFYEVFLTWWAADATKSLIFFPMMLSFLNKESQTASFKKIISIVGIVSVLSFLVLLKIENLSYLFVLFPFIFCAQYYAGEKGSSLALLIIFTFSIVSLRTPGGAFQPGTTKAYLVNLELFLLSIFLTSLFLKDFHKTGYLKTTAVPLMAGWLLSGLVFATFHMQRISGLVQEDTLPVWVATITSLFTVGIGAFIVNSKMLEEKAHTLASQMTLKLRDSEEKLRLIFESTHDILFLTSRKKDGVLYCISINKAHEIMTGEPNSKYINQPLESHLPADVFRTFSAKYLQSYETGKPVVWEQVMDYPKGRHYLIITINSIKNNNTEEQLFAGTIFDITERKIAEELLRQQQVKLTLSAKMSSLGEMASGIAHEINNPLTIINSKAFQMRRNREKGTFDLEKEMMDLYKIEETTNRIAKIIRGLLAFSRNAEGDPKENVKVNQILEDTIELCGERFKHHSIRLTVNCKTEEMIYCRSYQVTQVLMNLLSNAHDAIEHCADKWVTIEAFERENKIIISVQDSGSGIPFDILDKIMNPFFTTKEVGKGTGLGLSISKGIVEEHKGHFYYDNKNQHTTFVLEFSKAETVAQKSAA